MRKVELRMNEQFKYETIKELVDHKGNKNRASKKLGISVRQVNRLIIIYKEKGKEGFVHGNRFRKPVNAINNSISEDIILLYNNKYQDFNFRHFNEYLDEEENIKVSPLTGSISPLSVFKKALYHCKSHLNTKSRHNLSVHLFLDK